MMGFGLLVLLLLGGGLLAVLVGGLGLVSRKGGSTQWLGEQRQPTARQVLEERFGLDEDTIRGISLAAVEASWAPGETKAQLADRMNSWWDAGE